MDDSQKVATIRAELPATTRSIYMNAGTNGPLPRCAHDAMAGSLQRELTEGRIGLDGFTEILAAFQRARDAVAETLGCDALDIALTHNTTEGINIALMGLTWSAGDEVVTADTEHPGVLYPIYLLRQRYGVRIRMTSIGKPGVDPVKALVSALTLRTRAVVLSHVAWSTGVTLPIADLAEVAHRVGALLVCDAAQSCGAVPSRVLDLGVDAYALSGQKWLCGPDGTGALFVRRDRLEDFRLNAAGYHTIPHGMSDLEGNFVPTAGAARYEVTTINPATARGFTASLNWLRNEVGWDWALARIARLAGMCHDALAQIPGVTVISPRETLAGLLHFSANSLPASDIVKRLAQTGILVRAIPDTPLVRVSIGFYNTEDEIERLAAHVSAIASGQ